MMLDGVRWLEIHLDTGQRTDTFQGRCLFSMTCDVHEHHVARGGEWRD